MTTPAANPVARRAFSLHDRLWQANRYVYPVVSRRSKGISVGINLNPDKVCNFDCIYCSVDRTPAANASPPEWAAQDVDLPVLRQELESMLDLIYSGGIHDHDPFDKIPAELRRLNDIAFSGDGEPTTCPQFDAVVRLAAKVLSERKSPDLPSSPAGSPDLPSSPRIRPSPKLVLITNATMFHRPAVRDTLAFLDAHHGEIWAKLDAGTDAYYHLIDRTSIPFHRVLDNLLWCCQTRPTIIQTLLMKVHGNPPPAEEISAYIGRLRHIADSGGMIKLIQLYTVARRTTEAFATSLSAEELEQIAAQINALPAKVEIYP